MHFFPNLCLQILASAVEQDHRRLCAPSGRSLVPICAVARVSRPGRPRKRAGFELSGMGFKAVGAVYAARCTPSLPFCCCAAVADRLADSFSTSGATTTAASSSGGRERRPWWTHGDVCRRPRRPGGGGRRRPATAGLRQLEVPPRFERVDRAPGGTAAPHLKRFATEKRPFPVRGDKQDATTASIVLPRRCKMTVCND